jgi:hypothetical protein
MWFIVTQPGILSVLPRLKYAMIKLGKSKEIVPCLDSNCLPTEYNQQYGSYCIRIFPTKQFVNIFVNIFVNLFHLCLSKVRQDGHYNFRTSSAACSSHARMNILEKLKIQIHVKIQLCN